MCPACAGYGVRGDLFGELRICEACGGCGRYRFNLAAAHIRFSLWRPFVFWGPPPPDPRGTRVIARESEPGTEIDRVVVSPSRFGGEF